STAEHECGICCNPRVRSACRVREHPIMGPYVERPVQTRRDVYADIKVSKVSLVDSGGESSEQILPEPKPVRLST
ncbi:hypothetical protein cypCar_00047339, partial [Cyprinus carpio]